MNYLHQEILRILKEHNATYSKPLSSFQLSTQLNLNPAYIRFSIQDLLKEKKILVRRGKGGGYFLNNYSYMSKNAHES